MIRYIAIDPGIKACGFATRTKNNEIITVVLGIDPKRPGGGLTIAHPSIVTHAVIEETNGYAGSLKAAFALAEMRGRLIQACYNSGLEVIRVNVSTWQSAMLGKDRKGRTKELSIQSAKSIGVDTDDHNIADAVNLLVYAELNDLGRFV